MKRNCRLCVRRRRDRGVRVHGVCARVRSSVYIKRSYSMLCVTIIIIIIIIIGGRDTHFQISLSVLGCCCRCSCPCVRGCACACARGTGCDCVCVCAILTLQYHRVCTFSLHWQRRYYRYSFRLFVVSLLDAVCCCRCNFHSLNAATARFRYTRSVRTWCCTRLSHPNVNLN